MSLNSHLRDRESPVRAWLETRFAHTRQVSTEANRFVRNGRTACPISPPAASDASIVGTAVDYLVRAHLAPTALDSTVARKAAWRTQELAHKALLAEHAAVTRAKALRPWERELDEADWAALCTVCALLAKFEQCFRAGLAVSFMVEIALDKVAKSDDTPAVVGLTVGKGTLADLSTLGRAAVADHLDLRRAEVLHLNPTFAQSRGLGGADADLVYDGTLLDFKATGSTQIIVRRVLWQLLGYALADTSDAHGIKAVGVSALRWRRRLIWPLDELTAELMAEPAPTVAALRAEFAVVVEQAGQARLRANQTT